MGNPFMIQSNGLTMDIDHEIYAEGTRILGFSPGGGNGKPLQPNQGWTILRDPLGSSHYLILSGACDLCIGIGTNVSPTADATDDVSDRGVPITLQVKETAANHYQLWDFLPYASGGSHPTVYIQNPQTGYVIELQTPTSEGSYLAANLRRDKNSTGQAWTALDEIGENIPFPVLEIYDPGYSLQGNLQVAFVPESQKNHLTGISVTIDVIEDIVVAAGCTIQVNCNTPYLGPAEPDVSNDTAAQIISVDKQEFQGDTEDFERDSQWIQFGIWMQNNQLTLFNQTWSRLGTVQASEFPSVTSQSSDILLSLKNNTIPAGSRIILNITMDQNDFAIGIAGLVLDGSGLPIGSPVYYPAIGLTTFPKVDGSKAHQKAFAPIGAIIVCFCSLPGNSSATFTSGSGVIAITATPNIAATKSVPNPHGIGTGETSNMFYGPVPVGYSHSAYQTFQLGSH